MTLKLMPTVCDHPLYWPYFTPITGMWQGLHIACVGINTSDVISAIEHLKLDKDSGEEQLWSDHFIHVSTSLSVYFYL